MIQLKVFLYNSANEENGYRGTEYTDYVLQGGSNVEDITQEIDTSEITLMGIDREEQFTPSTKFIIDVYENGELAVNSKGEPLTYHREVSQDFVSQPIIEDNSYFKHEISLAEPSVSFQHRIVDNMAVTYKLKDVSLQTKKVYDFNLDAAFTNSMGKFVPADTFTDSIQQDFLMYYYRYGKYLAYDNKPYFLNISNSNKYYQNINQFNNNTATVRLPHLNIYGGIAGTKDFEIIGQASYNYFIKEYGLNGAFNGIVAQGTIISNSSFYGKTGAGWQGYGLFQSEPNIDGWLSEGNIEWDAGIPTFNFALRQYANPSAPAPNYDITFPIQQDKKYVIETTLYAFPEPSVFNVVASGSTRRFSYTRSDPTGYNDDWVTIYPLYVAHHREYSQLSPDTYNSSIEYFVYSDGSKDIVLTSAQHYSLTKFIQKAILNSGDYEKMPNVATGNINHKDNNGIYDYPCPIYIDESFIGELNQTNVVENFYHQKNLWEIFLEAGYYIHAIPEIKFGQNDKYMLTFNKLGQTDETKGVSTPVAIYNFRGIDDYIAETDSYVDNMVQLGGFIREWVSPKSTDENFIVCNNNIEIISTHPIIELIKLRIRANVSYSNICAAGDIADATEFIYEENVYKILDIVSNIVPNKGIALYYQLGDNKIKGCNYRLPQENTTAYSDYSIKKVIYSAFVEYDVGITAPEGPWGKIKVNDFSFELTYRTKSDVRQSHARPDLRKYLLKSKFDNVPVHRQFNNQQDVLVDSENFGHSLYGTLIRTGNTDYKKQEWVNSPRELKTKGEICRINDEIYYVAKVSNIFYSDHIVSMVDYSKDYNQLSKVIGIPSEPRFYEISEQSQIVREKNINDYLLIGTESNVGEHAGYLQNLNHLRKLIFGDPLSESDFSRYAVMVFKGDKDIGTDSETFGIADFYKECIFPLNAYSSMGTLTYEINTRDNFSAGDKVVEPTGQQITGEDIDAVDGAYKSLQAVQYTDKYGKATLFDFYILEKIDDLTTEEIQNLPECPFATRYTAKTFSSITSAPTNRYLTNLFYNSRRRLPTMYDKLESTLNYGTYNGEYVFSVKVADGWDTEWDLDHPKRFIGDILAPIDQSGLIYSALCVSNVKNNTVNLNPNGTGAVLLKDCREQININYNLKALTDSDTFIYSQFLFQPKEIAQGRTEALSIVLLSEEVNKLTNGYFNNNTVLSITWTDSNNIEHTDNEFHKYGLQKLNTNLYGDIVSTKLELELTREYDDNDTSLTFLSDVLTDNDFGENGRVKAIVLAYNFNYQGGLGNNKFIIARNIPKTFTKQQALANWYIQPYSKDIFNKKQ